MTSKIVRIDVGTRDSSWFDAEFRRIGDESSREFGMNWLAINIAITRSLAVAKVDISLPFIKWMCYVIARGICMAEKQGVK